MSQTQLSPQMQQCIEERQRCASVCLNMAATHCLEMCGKHVEPFHYRTMLDCAEICQTSANFMMRGSDLHVHTCAACAEVCTRCAESCARMSDDLRMAACAEMCRRCADSCHHMAMSHA